MKKILSVIFTILLLVSIAIWYTFCRDKGEKSLPIGLKNASGEITSEFQFHDSVIFQAADLEPRTRYAVRIVGEDGRIVRDLRLVSDSKGRIPETIIWYNVGVRPVVAGSASQDGMTNHLTDEETLDLTIVMGYTVEVATADDNRLVRQILFQVMEYFTRPVLYAADSRGYPKSGFLIGEENVWVVGKNFPAGSVIRLWAVPAGSFRKAGDKLVEKTNQYGLELPPQFVLEGGESGFKRLLWSKNFTSYGSYDIVAEVATYDAGTHQASTEPTVQYVISYLSHTGFVIQRRAGYKEHLEVEISGARKSPFTFRDTFLTDEDVYVGVDPGVQPSKSADVAYAYIVADKNEAQWAQHINDTSDLLDDDDVTGGATTIIIAGVCGNCWNQLAWPHPLPAGDYDIVLDFDRDKRYTPGTDLIDGVERAGFSVADIRVDTITFTPGPGKISIYNNYKKEDITGPEYEAVNMVNKPVAWVMGTSQSVSVTLVAASTVDSALIWADSGLGGLANSGAPVPVTFAGGRGRGTFPVNSVPATIGKHTFYWGWKYKTSSSGSEKNMGVTGEHLLYTVRSYPQAPMAKPWRDVLEYAANWADGETGAAGVSKKIVTRMYNHGMEYNGYSEHYTYPGYKTFYLNQLFSDLRTPGLKVYMDCRDCANFFHCLTNALGFDYQYIVIMGEDNSGFRYKSMQPMGYSWCNTDIWNYHQVGWCGSMVADGSARLDCPEPLVTAACDLTAAEYFGYIANKSLKGVEYGVCSPQK